MLISEESPSRWNSRLRGLKASMCLMNPRNIRSANVGGGREQERAVKVDVEKVRKEEPGGLMLGLTGSH